MAKKVYVLTLHVPEDRLGTVIDTVAGTAQIVSIVPSKESAMPVGTNQPHFARMQGALVEHHTMTRNRGYAGGRRNKGISGKDLAIQILSTTPVKIWEGKDIQRKFAEKGFAPSSASPNLTLLARDGKVRAWGNGRFSLPHVTVHMGAGVGVTPMS